MAYISCSNCALFYWPSSLNQYPFQTHPQSQKCSYFCHKNVMIVSRYIKILYFTFYTMFIYVAKIIEDSHLCAMKCCNVFVKFHYQMLLFDIQFSIIWTHLHVYVDWDWPLCLLEENTHVRKSTCYLLCISIMTNVSCRVVCVLLALE